MHLAYRNHPDVAGVFVLSGFLNKESAVYQVSSGFKKKQISKCDMKHKHNETKIKLTVKQ